MTAGINTKNLAGDGVTVGEDVGVMDGVGVDVGVAPAGERYHLAVSRQQSAWTGSE